MGQAIRNEVRRRERKEAMKQSCRPCAQQRWVRMSAFKVRRILDLIRGKPVEEALDILANLPHRAARQVRKVLLSAIANAENNCKLEREKLLVSKAYADEGFTIPRIRPRAMGRAYRIRKRTCHITLWVEEE